MTVPIGVLVVVDDYFDGIYAQVRVHPRVSVSVYAGVRLYDWRVHVCFYIVTWRNVKSCGTLKIKSPYCWSFTHKKTTTPNGSEMIFILL